MKEDEIFDDVRRSIVDCRLCSLSDSRTMAVPGCGFRQACIMFVGEAPGAQEDIQGQPFVGAAGNFLDQLLSLAGIRRQDVFITNIIKCRPPGNRDPEAGEIESCRPYLLSQIALIQPRIICTLGRHALREIIGPEMSISRDHGRPLRQQGLTVFPMYHPAAAIYRNELKQTMKEDFLKLKDILNTEALI